MSDQKYLVLTALGADRPGLVAEVSAFVTERQANVEDSRMAVMGAEFGILLLVAGSAEAITAIERDVALLTKQTGLAVLTRPTKSPQEHRRARVIPCMVSAETLDHEGIVQAITRAMHQLGVNIVALECAAYQAPVTGSPLFRLEARVDVPESIPVGELRRTMGAVAEAENLEIDVRSLIGERR